MPWQPPCTNMNKQRINDGKWSESASKLATEMVCIALVHMLQSKAILIQVDEQSGYLRCLFPKEPFDRFCIAN